MKLPSLMIFLNRQGRFCFYSYNFGGVIMKETNKKNGRYGIHGGQYIPEVLMREVLQLEKEYEFYKKNIRMAKSYGFNTIRFHSVVPPEECFRAADER